MRPAAQWNQSQLQIEVSHIHKPSIGLHVDPHHWDFVFITLLTWVQFMPHCLHAANISDLLKLIETITYWQLNKWLLKKIENSGAALTVGRKGRWRLKNEHRMKGMWLFAESNWMKQAFWGGFCCCSCLFTPARCFLVCWYSASDIHTSSPLSELCLHVQ